MAKQPKTAKALVSEEPGLAFACILDGEGGGRQVGWQQVRGWKPVDGPLWVHLDKSAPEAVRWLNENAGLSEVAVTSLTADETRPRTFMVGDGLVTVLRGVNLNPDADPDDMVAIRIWVDHDRVISVRQRRLMTPRDILADLTERHNGPKAAPELFMRLAERLTERMNGVIVRLDEHLDEIEARLETENHAPLRRELVDLRQSIVGLRRYLGPQREALSSLQFDAPTWLNANHRIALREISDRLLRYLEDLDAARERAVVVKDEITNQLAETMNRTMYALSIIAGVFLPLGFITGLLGINVGGMPGVDSAYAFWITCGVLVVLVIGEVYLFKKLKWIGN